MATGTGQYNFDIHHKPGVEHVAPDTFSRMCSAVPGISLLELHKSLGHPGYARFYHFIRQGNLPFSSAETKTVCKNCHTCAEAKPQFFKSASQTLIKAVCLWDRISVDFKGPVSGPHPYLLIVVVEHSSFPFVFPCKNMKSSTVTLCLSSLFCFFGFPGCVRSDRDAPFLSRETRFFLAIRGITFSTSTPYYPQGNSQCERSNQTIWRTIKLLLHSERLSEDLWETVLPEGLHAVRSLVCLSTNETPHERFLRFPRKAMAGSALPSWLLHPGPVLLRRHVRNKGDPLCDPVELVEGNQTYSVMHLVDDGQENMVSTSDLAPFPRSPAIADKLTTDVASHPTTPSGVDSVLPNCLGNPPPAAELPGLTSPSPTTDSFSSLPCADVPPLRRSTRFMKPPDRFGDWSV